MAEIFSDRWIVVRKSGNLEQPRFRSTKGKILIYCGALNNETIGAVADKNGKRKRVC